MIILFFFTFTTNSLFSNTSSKRDEKMMLCLPKYSHGRFSKIFFLAARPEKCAGKVINRERERESAPSIPLSLGIYRSGAVGPSGYSSPVNLPAPVPDDLSSVFLFEAWTML